MPLSKGHEDTERERERERGGGVEREVEKEKKVERRSSETSMKGRGAYKGYSCIFDAA